MSLDAIATASEILPMPMPMPSALRLGVAAIWRNVVSPRGLAGVASAAAALS
jgi:hypothetical protein